MGLYETVNEKQKQIIIYLGELMYEKLNLHTSSEKDIESLIKKSVNIDEQLEHSFLLGKKESESTIEFYKHTCETLEKQIQKKETHIDDLYSKLESRYQLGYQQGKDTQENLDHKTKEQLSTLENLIYQLQPVQYKNPKEKGDSFESMISNKLVTQIHRFAYVEDTSDIWGSGDRIICFPTYKMMVECKHKTTIQKSDIDQFQNHYLFDFKQKKYQMALFLSFSCDSIVGKGSFSVEYIQSNIVGYIGLPEKVTSKLKLSIIVYFLKIMNDLYESHSDTSKHKSHDYMTTYLLDIHNDILLIEKNELPLVQSIQMKYTHKKNKLNQLLHDFETQNIQIPVELQSTQASESMFIENIVKQIPSDYIIPKLHWKQSLIQTCNLNQFYSKFLNKKGITREKIVNCFFSYYSKEHQID